MSNTTRECLLKEYKYFLSFPNEENSFLERCVEWLSDADVHSCFKVLPFDDIKKGYLEKVKDKKKLVNVHLFDDLESALKNLEKYVQNLWKKPWCKAFHMIKIFNGFFKYKIEQWIPLDTICKVLELMGYHKTSEGVFEIEKLNEERMLVVGLELYFAHTQLFICRTHVLGNSICTVDNMLEAWIQTNGSSITRLESGLFNQIQVKDSFQPSSGSSRITTTIQHQYFDKNGQSTHEYRNSLKSSDLEQACRISSEDKMPSSISNDQMYEYDDETATTGQNHSDYSPSHQKQSLLSRETRYSGNYNTATYASMPSAVYAKPRLDFKTVGNYHHSKNNLQNLSAEQLYGGTSEDIIPNMNKHKEDCFSAQNEKTKEDMVPQVKPRESGLLSLQVQESLFDEKNERCQNILKARVEAGEKDLQKERSKDDIIMATDVTNQEQRCYICDNTAVVICLECTETVCSDCLNIFMRKPCTDSKENRHTYNVIKNNEPLYENFPFA